ncbi:bacteriohemerythrin [Litorilituus sediminis]|uniref:Hemerythrin n=1 Tax=Litorilituus sediminis TaxID=718192 RepID=A0A4P6P370_9GAMM|nr:bacteriohemerythrin [Litorilituus sediminis]QBG35664.1 hemerythrin [Litorilituus sediminis]
MSVSNKTKSALFYVVILLMSCAIVLAFVFPSPLVAVLPVAPALMLMPMLRQKHIRQIKWSNDYNLGIDYIDEDHKKLVHLLNQFSIAYDYAQCEEFERDALHELVRYTKYHFRREEALMEEYGYPNLEAHKEEHKAMIDAVDGYVKIYQEQGHESLKQVTNLLEFWLINHIKEADKEYSNYLERLGADVFDID